MKKIIFLFSLIFILNSCSNPNRVYIELDEPKLNSILDSYVEQDIYPFLYSRIEDDKGKVIYEHSVVNRKILGDEVVSGDSWIRIWSMTKLVTISILMDMVEDDLLELNDDVLTYIPEFKNLKVAVDKNGISLSKSKDKINGCSYSLVPMNTKMTVENLMNHTAGFYYAYTGIACLDSMISSKNIPIIANGDQLVNSLSTLPLIQHPGESYYYGLNTAVLGIIIERISGQSLRDVYNERISIPFGIADLSYVLPKDEHLIPPFTGRYGNLREAIENDLPILGKYVPWYDKRNNLHLGGIGMVGTAKAYISFLRLLFYRDFNFLNKQTISRMSSKPIDSYSEDGYNTGYAFYLTSGERQYDKNILTVGGYEFTKGWLDRKNKLIGVLFSQVIDAQDKVGLGSQLEEDFKKELFTQLNAK